MIRNLNPALQRNKPDLEQGQYTQRAETTSESLKEFSVLCRRTIDERTVSEDDLGSHDRTIEESVLETTALACRSHKTASHSDARKFHYHRRQQAFSHCSGNELVHGYVGLDECGHCGHINGQDLVKM